MDLWRSSRISSSNTSTTFCIVLIFSPNIWTSFSRLSFSDDKFTSSSFLPSPMSLWNSRQSAVKHSLYVKPPFSLHYQHQKIVKPNWAFIFFHLWLSLINCMVLQMLKRTMYLICFCEHTWKFILPYLIVHIKIVIMYISFHCIVSKIQ